jgi:hypothetical protein
MIREPRLYRAIQDALDLPGFSVQYVWWECHTCAVKVQVDKRPTTIYRKSNFYREVIPVDEILRDNGIYLSPSAKRLPDKAIPVVAEYVVLIMTARILSDAMLGKD